MKKRGRPKTGIGQAIGLRLYPELDTALGRFIASQPETRSRPEAIRHLLTDALVSAGYMEKQPWKQ